MLPAFEPGGDLPEGIHIAHWPDIEDRFGRGSGARSRAYAKLRHLHEPATRTGKLAHFLVFGSFVSAAINRDGTKRGIVEIKT